MTIVVDNFPASQASLSTSRSLSLPLYGPLYLGGLPPRVSPARRAWPFVPFVGCIRDVQVGGEERVVFGDAVGGLNVADCDVEACAYQPCENNGTCHL